MKITNVVKIMVFLAITLFAFISHSLALEPGNGVYADFKIHYMKYAMSYEVNNAFLPQEVGENLPYKLHISNLSKGDSTYEWFVKYPNQDYVQVSTEPNPVIEISSYGKVFIKLRLNHNDSLTREYYVCSRDYSILKDRAVTSENIHSVQEDVYSIKTTVTDIETIVSDGQYSDLMPDNKNLNIENILKSDFEISYVDSVGNRVYNVSNGAIPNIVAELPYKVQLTNRGSSKGFVWFIKVPGYDYVWMDNTQNAVATVWHYGTTKFKLVIDNNIAGAVEYTVTAYGPGDEKKLNEAMGINNTSRSKDVKVDFELKYINSDDGIIYNASNAELRDDIYKFPYKILPINLSKGDKVYEWMIKKPGSKQYEPITTFPVTIDCYGPVYIKLRVNGSDDLACEKKIVSYFADNSPQSSGSEDVIPKADFRVLKQNASGAYTDVTGGNIIDSSSMPCKLDLKNISSGNSRNMWYVKLPGQDYVAMDDMPSPIAKVWRKGTIWFKLVINDDPQQTAEYSVNIN